ncbi:adenosylmethionine decarboxylase [Rhodobacteraceae bacterium]|nr:adenosylmethionine decarboxylase [Paracoccaceae bacterium]
MDGADITPAPTAKGLGTHLIIDVSGGQGLDDKRRVETALRDAVAASGATLLGIHLHQFAPQGVTGVAMLAESHISVHTWPELGFAAFDAFMCGKADPWAVVDVLSKAFETTDVQVRAFSRGDRA